MKKSYRLLCLLCLLACLAGMGLSAPGQAEEMRYFMQSESEYASPTPYGSSAENGFYAKTADARIYYEVYRHSDEKAPWLLMLHGGGVGSAYELGGLADALRPRFNIVLMNNRGHGRSEIGATQMTFRQKADDAAAVARSVTGGKVRILGFSDGAYSAYALAIYYPELVERIVAIGAGTLEAGFFPPKLDLAALKKMDPEFFELQERIRPEPSRMEEFLNSYMAFWNRMSVNEEMLGKIAAPVLLVAGDRDDHAPPETMLRARSAMKNAQLLLVPGQGHMCFTRGLDIVKAAAVPFLTGQIPQERTE